jgi:hypothetical protein
MIKINKNIVKLIFIFVFFLIGLNSYAEENEIVGGWIFEDDQEWIFNRNTLIMQNVPDDDYFDGPFEYTIDGNELTIFFDEEDAIAFSYVLRGDNLILTNDVDTYTLKKRKTYKLTQYDEFTWDSFLGNLNMMLFSPWAVRNSNDFRRAMNLIDAKDYETAREFGDDVMIRPIFMIIFTAIRGDRESKTKEIETLFSNTHNRNMELSQYIVEISRMFMYNDIEAMKRIILFSKDGIEYSKYFE